MNLGLIYFSIGLSKNINANDVQNNFEFRILKM